MRVCAILLATLSLLVGEVISSAGNVPAELDGQCEQGGYEKCSSVLGKCVVKNGTEQCSCPELFMWSEKEKDCLMEVAEENLCDTYLKDIAPKFGKHYECTKLTNQSSYALTCAKSHKAMASYKRGALKIDLCAAICDKNPCKNRGVCERSEKVSYYCRCPPSYTGPKCEDHFEQYTGEQLSGSAEAL
ncbi:hypothetical protein HPB50_021155 [Hyalomma asiaticum]|uniref:Uncharacterized protein n=1 Tax=Hyalomma asiaticum TaxID=266040 RepID=A0ACB7S7V8_HYAAI|nr:hypothetical protein HPB50_021155 [Hyalomma asiaticum]